MAKIKIKEWYNAVQYGGGMIFDSSTVDAISGFKVAENWEFAEIFYDYFETPLLFKNLEKQLMTRKYGERYIYFDVTMRDPATTVIDVGEFIKSWLIMNSYKIWTWYTSIIQKYNPVENYDRLENSTREIDTDFTGGSRSATKGAQSDTESQSLNMGSSTDTLSYGLKSTETTYGEQHNTNAFGEVTVDVDTLTEISKTAFTSENYKDAEKELGDNSTTTLAHSDSVTQDEHSDTVREEAHSDSVTKGARSDSTSTTRNEGARTDTQASYTDTTDTAETFTSRIHGNIGVMTAGTMLKEQRQVALFNFWEEVYKALINDMCEGVL